MMAILWMPICIYVSALTFNQVSGIDVYVIVPVACVICTAYTCIGGIKGVIWTDVLQGIIMIGSMALVMVKGTIDLGGLSVVIARNWQTERLVVPETSFDPTARMGIFAVMVGGTLLKLQDVCINQPTVQRFLSLPDVKAVKRALIWSILGLILLIGMCCYVGLLAAAKYFECDPITTGLARAKDQVIPLYVMDIASIYPGVVGLFVSGVFSAGLSSLSTMLNSVAGVVLNDFIIPYRETSLTERQTAYILRGSVLFFGIISMFSVRIVEHLGMVMQLSASMASITCGPMLGAFSIGMLLPFVNTKSLIAGLAIASSITSYIVARAQVDIASGQLQFPSQPVSVAACEYEFDLPANWNATLHDGSTMISSNQGWQLHHISFLWYTLIGAASTIIFSLLATLVYGKQDPSLVPPELLSPCVRNYWLATYKSVDTADISEKQKPEDAELIAESGNLTLLAPNSKHSTEEQLTNDKN